MKKIVLTDQAEQLITEYLDNGEPIAFKFNYRPNALSWFFSFTYKNIQRYNIKLSSGTNILKSFQNLMPIDLYVKTSEILEEPYLVNSFSLGLSELYLVSHQERDEIINGTLKFEEN